MKIRIVSSNEVNKQKRLDAEYYIEGKVKCSLCKQEFYKSDKDIESRKEQHEKKHDPTIMKASKNNILGKIEWIDVK